MVQDFMVQHACLCTPSYTSRTDGWIQTGSRDQDQTPNRSFLFQPAIASLYGQK